MARKERIHELRLQSEKKVEQEEEEGRREEERTEKGLTAKGRPPAVGEPLTGGLQGQRL